MRRVILCAMAAAMMTAPVFAGRIVVNHDEWTMGTGQPNAQQFAVNVANFLGGGSPGNILIYTDNTYLTNAGVVGSLQGAGYTVSNNLGITFDLPTLLTFDAIFMGGSVVNYNAQVLTDYVNAGGGVYLMAGTGFSGAFEADGWDSFLNAFGLAFGPSYNGIAVTQTITSTHPIFNNVASLYFNNGNSVQLFGNNPNAQILESFQGQGMIGVYDSRNGGPGEIPEPSTVLLTGTALLGAGWLARRRRR